MCPFDREDDERDQQEERHKDRGDIDPVCDLGSLLEAWMNISPQYRQSCRGNSYHRNMSSQP